MDSRGQDVFFFNYREQERSEVYFSFILLFQQVFSFLSTLNFHDNLVIYYLPIIKLDV